VNHAERTAFQCFKWHYIASESMFWAFFYTACRSGVFDIIVRVPQHLDLYPLIRRPLSHARVHGALAEPGVRAVRLSDNVHERRRRHRPRHQLSRRITITETDNGTQASGQLSGRCLV